MPPEAGSPRAAFALLGPTASGKSVLAMELALRLGNLEIVSVDSAQVYRGMDIGTAKPGANERSAVAHHLIDIADPTERYSAGRFRVDALRAIEDILERKKIPLLVGGTMLYYRALAQGLDEMPAADPKVRESISRDAARKGWPGLHAELARVDAKAAARIMPTDAQRIQRALEVFRVTGRPISAMQTGKGSDLTFALKAFSLMPGDRTDLHRRIAERFGRMLKAGFVDEVRALRAKYALDADLPSMRSVGYRDAWAFLEGDVSEKEMRERAIAATRQLAKRQMTWLRALAAAPADGLERALRSAA